MKLAAPIEASAAWRSVFILLIVYTISVFNRQIMTILVVPIQLDLGLSYVQVAVLLGTAHGVSYIFGSLALGSLVDSAARRPLLFTTVVAGAVANIIGALSPVYGALVGSRLLLGVAQSALPPSAHSILGDSFARDRATLPLSIFSLGAPIGISVALAFGGILLQWADAMPPTSFLWLNPVRSWELILFATGVVTLITSLLVLALREPVRSTIGGMASPGKTPDFLKFLRRHKRLFACHFSLFALSTLVSANLVFWSPQHMHQHFGWSYGEIGVSLAVVSLVGSVSSGLMGGHFSDVLYRKGFLNAPVLISVCSFIFAIPFVVMAFLTDSPFIFLGCFFVAFAVTQNQGLASVAIQLVTPARMRGRLSSLYFAAVTVVAMMIGPILVGWLTQYVFTGPDRLATSLVVVMTSCMVLASLVALAALKPMSVAAKALADGHSPVRPSLELIEPIG